MSDAHEVRDLTPDEHETWNAFVADSSFGSAYADTRYLAALCEAAGGSHRIRAVFKGDELVGGIPLYERRSRSGRYVSTRLLLYYNGVVLRDYDSSYPSRNITRHRRILEALEPSLREEGYTRVAFKPRSPFRDARVFAERGWSIRPGYTYVVPIDDLDAAWDRMEGNVKRMIDRARSRSLTVTEDDDFDSFFRLHREIHERKGAPLYLEETAFRRFVSQLLETGLGRLFHARLPGGRSVSTLLVLTGRHPVTHTVCAATEEDHLSVGASGLVRWEAFRRLSEAGSTANDLTDAALNPVTRFKRQLGGNLVLNLVVHRTDSLPFRIEQGLRSYGRKIRGLARGGLRRTADLIAGTQT